MSVFDLLRKQGNTIEEIPVALIHPNPFQPRKSFNENELLMLAKSIKENGLIQPIAVRKSENGFELVAGERRLRACLILNKEKVAAIVYELEDSEAAAWAVIENLQRSDLGVFEEVEGIEKLISLWNVSREEAASRLGMASSTLSNKLRLLKLSDKTKEIVNKYNLSERHARELLRILSDSEQEKAALFIAEKNLNVAETERYISSLLEKEKKARKKPVYIVKDVRLFINTFEHAVDVMNSSGIGAVSTVSESEENITYTVTIPKSTAIKKTRRSKPTCTAPAYSAYASSVI